MSRSGDVVDTAILEFDLAIFNGGIFGFIDSIFWSLPGDLHKKGVPDSRNGHGQEGN